MGSRLGPLTFSATGSVRGTGVKPGGAWSDASGWSVYSDCSASGVIMRVQLPAEYTNLVINSSSNCSATLFGGMLEVTVSGSGSGSGGGTAVYTLSYSYNVTVSTE